MALLSDLPFELFHQISDQLTRKDLTTLSRLSKRLSQLCQPIIYRSLNSDLPSDPPHYQEQLDCKWYERLACYQGFSDLVRIVKIRPDLADLVQNVTLDRCILQMESRSPGKWEPRPWLRSRAWRCMNKICPFLWHEPRGVKGTGPANYSPRPKRFVPPESMPRAQGKGLKLKPHEIFSLTTSNFRDLRTLKIWSTLYIEASFAEQHLQGDWFGHLLESGWRHRSLDPVIYDSIFSLLHLTSLDLGQVYCSLSCLVPFLKLPRLRYFAADNVIGVSSEHSKVSDLTPDSCSITCLTLTDARFDYENMRLLLQACKRLEGFTFGDVTSTGGTAASRFDCDLQGVVEGLRKHKSSLRRISIDGVGRLSPQDFRDFPLLRELMLPGDVFTAWSEWNLPIKVLGVHTKRSGAVYVVPAWYVLSGIDRGELQQLEEVRVVSCLWEDVPEQANIWIAFSRLDVDLLILDPSYRPWVSDPMMTIRRPKQHPQWYSVDTRY